jgi:hypothetical protein
MKMGTDEEAAMALRKVWLETLADGLVRADQVVGIDAHQTPELAGKPSRWLVDVVVCGTAGSGHRDGWVVGVLHRTLAQTSHPPGEAPHALARMLAQLDAMDAAGVIALDTEARSHPDESLAPVRFRFTPFSAPEPMPTPDAEYL